jgi:RNA polymerase sigma-70 factor, ECF subfamily
MDQETISDDQIVLAVLGGARERFAVLVQRHEAAVRATALAILRDHHDTEDVMQVAFVTAYRKLATLRKRSSFGPWVLRIARHQALRAIRRKKDVVTLEGMDFPDGASDPMGIVDEEEGRLATAVAELPEQERVVVALHYFQGLTVIEVARVLDHPVGTVTKQISRAHRRLRERLRPLGEE